MAVKSRRDSNVRSTTSVDHHVGSRVRQRRIEIQMSQTDLANAARITFQQIQKYENGANRVSASRLWQFAAILGKPVDWFFEGIEKHKLSAATVKMIEAERKGSIEREGGGIEADTVKLARAIAKISDPGLKKRLKMIVSVLAAK